jgi:hypothetical protein
MTYDNAIQDCQIARDDLAIGACQITSNEDDACPGYLAMLVTSCQCHQVNGEEMHVKYRLHLLKTYLKPNIW